MLPRIRPILRAALAAPLAAAAAGCLASTTEVTGTGTTPPVAGLRFVQAVSDAPNGIDVSVNGVVALTGYALGRCFPVSCGQYGTLSPSPQIGVSATGATTAFYTQVASSIVNQGLYTAVVYGRVTSGATPAATVAVLADTNPSNVAANAVLLRAFNAIDYVTAGAGTPVDVYVYPQGGVRPSTPTLPNVAYGTRSAYVTPPTGSLTVDVLPAGRASNGAALFSGSVVLSTGLTRTLVLLDPSPTSGAPAVGSVLVVNDAG